MTANRHGECCHAPSDISGRKPLHAFRCKILWPSTTGRVLSFLTGREPAPSLLMELTKNSGCKNIGREKDPPPLCGVLATAAWQRSIARSKKIATATWWLQPQSKQQPR